MALVGTTYRGYVCINDLFPPSPINGSDAAGLTESFILLGGTQDDTIIFHSTFGGGPSTSNCGIPDWNPLVFHGREMAIDLGGATTRNTVTTPSGAPSYFVATAVASSHRVTINSSTGIFQFAGGTSQIRYNTAYAGNSVSVTTGGGADCFDLVGGGPFLLSFLDCGGGTDSVRNYATTRPASCENNRTTACF